MFPSLFANSALDSLEKTVEFAERRHSVLATNIANMDTPDYKTRDLSLENFQQSLKDVIEIKRTMAEDSPGPRFDVLEGPDRNETAVSQDEAVQNVFDSMRQVVYHDGSDDSLEMQVTRLAKNQSMHSTAIALMRSQFQTLRMAISENINI